MMLNTIKKAEDKIKTIKIIEITPHTINFCVKTSKEHDFADVWVRKKKGVIFWDCNVARNEYGCVLNCKADKSKPFCSHTLSAHNYLLKNGFNIYEDDIIFFFKKFNKL